MSNLVTDFIQQHFASAKTLVIFGLGREGRSSYQLLRDALPEAKMVLIDDQPLEKLAAFWHETLDRDAQTQFVSSQDAQDLDFAQSVVFQTPGIPLNHPLCEILETSQTQLTSNTQVFFDLVKALYPQFKIIGVTGTKGKSTTTSLIYHVLQTAGIPSWLGGNIGTPPLDLVPELLDSNAERGYVVLELSSHQLDLVRTSPQIAVIQNISPEHLDYYQTFARYLEAKSHIADYQTETDYVIYNPTYPDSSTIAQTSEGKKLLFAVEDQTTQEKLAASISDRTIYLHSTHFDEKVPVLDVSELPLKGKHNWENVLPGVVIGNLLSLTPEVIAKALRSFQPLAHRLEPVASVNGVDYYNDSLATVPDATIAALEALAPQPLVLIAGGFDRGVGVTALAKYLVTHPVKALVLFPTTGEQLAAEIEELRQEAQETLPTFDIEHVTTMAEAVKAATKLATEGDGVLMSPAAASFNLFKDYQDRGNQFKEEVLKLA